MTVTRSALQGGALPKWVSGTTYSLDTIVWSPISFLTYIRIVAGAGTTDPSADSTNWAMFGPSRRKSLQVVDVTVPGGSVSGTATITAVVPAKCRIMHLGTTSPGNEIEGRISVSSSTVVTVTRASAGATALIVRVQVEEDW